MHSKMSLSVQKVPGKCVDSLAASRREKAVINIKVHGICVRLHPGRPMQFLRVANEEDCRCAHLEVFLGKGKDTYMEKRILWNGFEATFFISNPF